MMLNGPKKTPQPLAATFLESHAIEGEVSQKKRKYEEINRSYSDQEEMKKSSVGKERSTPSRLKDALREPLRTKNSLSRFNAHIESKKIDASSGRSFKDMMDEQRVKGRPLIIARCLCGRHSKETSENNKFLHSEFIDGNKAFEAIATKKLFPSVIVNEFPGKSPTDRQSKDLEDFIRKDFELWAVNPLKMTIDVIADRAAISKEKFRLDTALETLLSCDIKAADEEDEIDQSYAYVVAGLYHAGYLVCKDEELALKSVTFLDECNLPSCQVDALKLSLDVDINVFSSLLALGLSPNDTDEHGWNIIDVVTEEIKGDIQESAIAILRRHNYM